MIQLSQVHKLVLLSSEETLMKTAYLQLKCSEAALRKEIGRSKTQP